MIFKVNTINTANKSVTEMEFGSYAIALACYKAKCEDHNIPEDEMELPFHPNTDLSSGGRGYDVIVELNCIED